MKLLPILMGGILITDGLLSIRTAHADPPGLTTPAADFWRLVRTGIGITIIISYTK